jgi:hypothetical protein
MIRIIRNGDELALYQEGRKIGEGKLNTARILEILGFKVAVDDLDSEDDDVVFPERINMQTGEFLDD